jgi:hypothetical protein
MQELEQNYQKYRWFQTSSDKLVVGGKSAEQNDSLLEKIKLSNHDFIVMHTSSPGSPFSVILADRKKITKKDLQETAIFTACFSKAWKSGARKASVDIFSSLQLHKNKLMKQGTWSVAGKVERIQVPLALVLTKQKSTLRAVPETAVKNKKDILLKIAPGNIDKTSLLSKLALELGDKFSQEDLLSALPSGGIRIIKK